MTIFEKVKSAIDMKTVAEGYGLHIDRGGMTLCPFHNEKTPSAKIYGDNFHCFGCGEHHDIIGFTQKLFQLNKPIDALKKLNTDFGLNIDVEKTPTKTDISEYQKRVNEQKAYREYEKNAWQILCDYLWLMREWKKRKMTPKQIEKELNRQAVMFEEGSIRNGTVNRCKTAHLISGLVNSVKSTICHFMVCIVSDTYLHRFL